MLKIIETKYKNVHKYKLDYDNAMNMFKWLKKVNAHRVFSACILEEIEPHFWKYENKYMITLLRTLFNYFNIIKPYITNCYTNV